MRKSIGACVVILTAALTISCTLKSDSSARAGSAANEKSPQIDYSQSQLIGKVKADEFNDQATGKEVPANGGEVVMHLRSETNNLNVWTANDAYGVYITTYIYNSLLRRNPETFEWEGSLAERWLEEDVVVKKDGTQLRGVVSKASEAGGKELEIKTSSGETLRVLRQDASDIRHGVSFTFFLRKGVRFHDGEPVTAEDVKFSFDTIKNEYVDDPALRNYYNDLKSCEVLDKYTVRLTYSKQYFLARSFAGGFEIFPKHVYDADNLSQKDPKAFGLRFNDSPFNRKPIGTGPYKFERWDTGLQVVLTRNDDYFDVPKRGHLDRLTFKFISDEVAALQALKNGEVNFVPEITPEQFQGETNTPQFLQRNVKAKYYVGNFRYIGWNMRRPPFDDVRVRQAMAYGALNRPEFIEKVEHGLWIQVSGGEFFFGPDYDHRIQIPPFDPEKAKQLLLEAGWYDRDGDGLRDKDGKPFRFELLMPSGREIYERRTAMMKENLRKLGIDMQVRELEWATYLENMADRKFDAYYGGWVIPVDSDPYQLWHSSQASNRGSNYTGFGNAETDAIIDKIRVTLDDPARHQLFFDLQRYQNDLAPYLFFEMEAYLGVYDKRYRGVKFYKGAGYDLSEWFLPQGN